MAKCLALRMHFDQPSKFRVINSEPTELLPTLNSKECILSGFVYESVCVCVFVIVCVQCVAALWGELCDDQSIV